MTTRPRIILVAGLLALALMSSCQSAQKSEKENQEGKSTAAPASRTTAETKVVLTPMSVETKPSTQASTQKKTGGATTMPVSSPSSPYTEDRLHDLEKGLRRLQSLPSMTKPAKTGSRSRKQRL